MNNEEKKQFLIDVHTLYMENRPYDNNKSLEESRKKDDEFWNIYYSSFKSMLPTKLYKYRKANKRAINNFKKDIAWFSHPEDFDDTVDSALNNDVEREIEEFKSNSSIILKELGKTIMGLYLKDKGLIINQNIIDEIFDLVGDDGFFDEDRALEYLTEKEPKYASKEIVREFNRIIDGNNNDELKNGLIDYFTHYMNMNKRIKTEAFALSLAEEGDNQAMWSFYADEGRGFCIEYEFNENDYLSQRMILNLFPIIYGDKPLISIFDVLKKGLTSVNCVNGISYEDYMVWFLSMYTKDNTYSFQKEWRITLDDKIGKNLQEFPFAKSIILGERMSARTAKRLIRIAKVKGISVYRREKNKTCSKINIKNV